MSGVPGPTGLTGPTVLTGPAGPPGPFIPFRSSCSRFPASTFTFFNTQLIQIIDLAPAVPYPSTINVSGLTGPITKVTVTLFNLSHQDPTDIDILLVGPDGLTNTILMSDTGGAFDIANVTLTFDDQAPSFLPLTTAIVSGTFKPTNFEFPPENLPAPAPPSSASVALSNFNGLPPNGTWSLFVSDDALAGLGSIAYREKRLSILNSP